MYVSFIGLRLTKTSLTLINRTRLRTKGQSAGYPHMNNARRILSNFIAVEGVRFQDKADSLILLVLPYTELTQARNCLFVSPYMKMLRPALVGRRTRHTQRHEMCEPTQILLRSFQVQENTFIPHQTNVILQQNAPSETKGQVKKQRPEG